MNLKSFTKHLLVFCAVFMLTSPSTIAAAAAGAGADSSHASVSRKIFKADLMDALTKEEKDQKKRLKVTKMIEVSGMSRPVTIEMWPYFDDLSEEDRVDLAPYCTVGTALEALPGELVFPLASSENFRIFLLYDPTTGRVEARRSPARDVAGGPAKQYYLSVTIDRRYG